MSLSDWESEIEFYDEVAGRLIKRLDQPFVELPFACFDTQDSIITYNASNSRRVLMRVMGFTAVNPMVFSRTITSGGQENLRRGELLGCSVPKEKDIIPGVLRTLHHPVLQEIGQGGGCKVLPIPVSHLVAHKPRR